jgi:hypothetical protein
VEVVVPDPLVAPDFGAVVVVVDVPCGWTVVGAVSLAGSAGVGVLTAPLIPGLSTMYWKIFLTRVAAACAPYPPWSMTARTRYCGLGFGPKATNQLLG